MPAPFASTKPSRSRSQGRLAAVGSSLRTDMALAEMNPARAVGVVANSAPPATMTSASPYLMRRAAMPMLWVEVVQALTTEMLGPLKP